VADFYIGQGDRRPPLVRTLTDVDGVPVDLTAATSVRFHMWRASSSRALVIDAVATKDPDQVTNPGKVSYSWVAGDTGAAGTYLAEWEVTWSAGITETYPNHDDMVIEIKAQGA
jgi:hypothetical protein